VQPLRSSRLRSALQGQPAADRPAMPFAGPAAPRSEPARAGRHGARRRTQADEERLDTVLGLVVVESLHIRTRGGVVLVPLDAEIIASSRRMLTSS